MKLPPIPSIPSLSDIPEDMKTMTVTLRHFLIVSHAVPVVRVRPLVPDQLALDTLKVNGETCAILQATCFYNENFHYTPLAVPSLDFWQMSYRVSTRQPIEKATNVGGGAAPGKVTVRSDPSAYFVQSYLGTRASWVVQRAVASEADYADFNVITRGEYATYVVDLKPTDGTPPTQVAVRSLSQREPVAPFVDWNRMVYFLTHRLNAYYKLSIGGNIGLLPVEHEPMSPLAAEIAPVVGEIDEARFGVWEELGLLNQDEMRRPFSVLIQPSIMFVTHPPRLVKTGQ